MLWCRTSVVMSDQAGILLAELHAHTTWSDGTLTTSELVDLYGGAGFAVLAVTDHVLPPASGEFLTEASFPSYLEEIEREAERAERIYGLTLMPGLELTYEHEDPARAGHAVAVGLRRFVGLENGLDRALHEARSHGAALIAAHPYAADRVATASRVTARFAEEPEWAVEAVDRFELFNRDELFAWVAERRLPAVATGDFHRPEHLRTWKTLLPCRRDDEAVVEHLRSKRECGLTRLDPTRSIFRRAA
jgi:predicted metal-dependent phosphoesterase TrpH